MRELAVVVVGSRPPPVAGQSLATAMLLRGLEERGIAHRVVDLSRAFDPARRRRFVARRALRLATLPLEVAAAGRRLPGRPVVYLQLGHGVGAMARDVPILAIAAANRWPTVVHVHGSGFRAAFDAAPRPLRAAMRATLRGVRVAIVLSESLRPMFDGLVPEERVFVVPNGVVREVSAHGAARGPARHPSGGLQVLFLTNLLEAKGYLDVLEAARLAHERGLPHRFVLAGAVTETTGIAPDEFAARHRLDNLRYAGPVTGDAKLELLGQSHVVTLPSRYEGQPLVLLEAMHYGMPVVVTPVGGIPDVVAHERNGLHVPVGDPEALLGAIDRLWRDRDLFDRVAGENFRAAARYTEDAHVERVIALLRDAAGAS